MVKEALVPEEIALCEMMHDPVEWKEFFWSSPDYDWRLRDYRLDWVFDSSDYQEYTCGRDVGKTDDIETDIIRTALSNPDRTGLFTAPNDVHLKPPLERIVRRLYNIPLFRCYVKRCVKFPSYEIEFTNGFVLYGRIAGTSGGTNLLGLHVDFVWVDETQIYPWIAVLQLQQCLNKGARLRLYGVPNGVRESYLFKASLGILNGEFSHHKVEAWRNPDFDEKKRKRLLKIYGGEKSQMWKNQVEADWGEPQFEVFDPKDLERCVIYLPDFRSLEIVSADLAYPYPEAIPLPYAPAGTHQVYLGMDVGYKPDPSIIMAFSLVGTKAQAFLKLALRGVPYPDQARIVDYLLRFYKPTAMGIDYGGVGRGLVMELHDEKHFPETNYSKTVIPVEFGGKMVIGYADDGKEIKENIKFKTTTMMQEAFGTKELVLPDDQELVDELQNHTKAKNIKGDYVYSGKDHHIDAVRCFMYARYQMVQAQEIVKSTYTGFKMADF